MHPLNHDLREILHELRRDEKLYVFMSVYLHANLRLRSWSGYDLIHTETGLARPTINKALDWFCETKAFLRVPFDKRVGLEKKLPARKSIYQLTGFMLIGERFYPYLYLQKEEDALDLAAQLDELGNSSLSELLKVHWVKLSQGEPKVTKESFKVAKAESKSAAAATPPKPKTKRKQRTPRKPDYGFSVNWSLVEGAGGSLQRGDGTFVTLPERPSLAQAALKLFAAYLDTLRGFGRMKLDGDEGLWDDQQADTLRLALKGIAVEDVQKYITYRYTDKDDHWWQEFPGLMKVEHLVKVLPFTYPEPAPEKSARADNSPRPASPEYPERRVYTQDELDALKAAADAGMTGAMEVEHGR